MPILKQNKKGTKETSTLSEQRGEKEPPSQIHPPRKVEIRRHRNTSETSGNALLESLVSHTRRRVKREPKQRTFEIELLHEQPLLELPMRR